MAQETLGKSCQSLRTSVSPCVPEGLGLDDLSCPFMTSLEVYVDPEQSFDGL